MYVGRACKAHPVESIWANPFRLTDNTRNEVITKYRQYLSQNVLLLSKLEELKYKTLGCWCTPLPCHADVINEFLELID